MGGGRPEVRAGRIGGGGSSEGLPPPALSPPHAWLLLPPPLIVIAVQTGPTAATNIPLPDATRARALTCSTGTHARALMLSLGRPSLWHAVIFPSCSRPRDKRRAARRDCPLLPLCVKWDSSIKSDPGERARHVCRPELQILP